MKLIADARNAFSQLYLKRQLKQVSRNVKTCNIDHAGNIGILFNATETVSFDIIRDFVKQLEGKKRNITALGYVHNKSLIDHYLYRKGFDFISKSDLNWFHRPNPKLIEGFTAKSFDILFDLSLDELYPIQYILATSTARFKVGKYSPAQEHLDFMIDISKEEMTMQLIQNELAGEKGNQKLHSKPMDKIASKSASTEIRLNFLINQLMHYLSQLKN